MSEAIQAIPSNAPVMVAWTAWRESHDGQEAVKLVGTVGLGQLWLAFFAGWEAKGTQP